MIIFSKDAYLEASFDCYSDEDCDQLMEQEFYESV